MRRNVAHAYDYLKLEHDRIRAAHVKIVAQKDRHLERRLFCADLDSSQHLAEMLPLRGTSFPFRTYARS